MICPRCSSEFSSEPASCPECGIQLLKSISGVMKTSAVMISSGGQRGFYSSVQDVPEPLRARLIEVTSSANSGTIVIADRAGKEQMNQASARRESACEPLPENPPKSISSLRLLGVPWIFWAAALLLLMAACIIGAAFLAH